jgi:hypothetical protein
MSPDVKVLFETIAPRLAARGLLLVGEPAATLRALCFAVAQDARLRARAATAPPEDRAALARLRPRLQDMARMAAWALGLLPIARVKSVPRDAEGRDAELWRWFEPVDRAALDAAVQAALAEATAWRDALTPEEVEEFTTHLPEEAES